MAEKEQIAKAPSGRPKREAVGFRNRLTIDNKDPNFVYRWVNVSDDRVDSFERAGYEIVDVSEHKVGGRRLSVGSAVDNNVSVGGGQKAVLMRQKKEYFDEDQRDKQKRTDAAVSGILNPSLEGSYGDIKPVQ